MSRFLMTGILLAILAGPVHAQAVLFVDKDAPPSGDGFTWDTAFDDLQELLDLAVFGITIRVAEGTYTPDRGTGDREATFRLASGITIEGGYAGFGEPDPDARDVDLYETVLSGDLNSDDVDDLNGFFACFSGSGNPFTPGCGAFNLDGDNDVDAADGRIGENSYHVATAMFTNTTAVLDGVTITGGNADGLGSMAEGAGLWMSGASPTIIGCRFENNIARLEGGAIFIPSGSPTVNQCVFTNNLADSCGAIRTDNSATKIRSSFFRENSASVQGGAVCIFDQTSITNSTFLSNSTAGDGGAIFSMPSSPNAARINNCGFLGNSAGDDGGAIQSSRDTTITNCLFAGNHADDRGGGVNAFGSQFVTINNCTFSANTAGIEARAVGCGGNTRPRIRNCILWDGGFEISPLGTCGEVVEYSNIQFGWPGTGNIFAIPLFADSDGVDNSIGTIDDDLRLLPGSPGIDAGANFLVPLDLDDLDGDGNTAERLPLDLDGNPRFVDDAATIDTGVADLPTYAQVVDMGAYEVIVCSDADDVDCDGVANADDNCPGVVNADQANFDADDDGDVCDPDIDDDGVQNDQDVCDFTPPGSLIQPNGTLRADADGDCDVDIFDFAIMAVELSGPNQ